jgi:hypothetical protein
MEDLLDAFLEQRDMSFTGIKPCPALRNGVGHIATIAMGALRSSSPCQRRMGIEIPVCDHQAGLVLRARGPRRSASWTMEMNICCNSGWFIWTRSASGMAAIILAMVLPGARYGLTPILRRIIRESHGFWWDRSKKLRFAAGMLSTSAGFVKGPVPLTIPAFVIRCGIERAQAAAYGPPPE